MLLAGSHLAAFSFLLRDRASSNLGGRVSPTVHNVANIKSAAAVEAVDGRIRRSRNRLRGADKGKGKDIAVMILSIGD